MEDKNVSTELKLFGDIAEKRSSAYQLLSSVYCRIPDRKLLTVLFLPETINFLDQKTKATDDINEVMIDGFKFINKFAVESAGKDLDFILQELAIEYTRLFKGIKVGYGPEPPYEAVYHKRNNRADQDLLREISHYYRQLGISYNLKERPDYIGLELDLMRYFAEQESRAWQEDLQDKAFKYLKEEKYFLEEHLSCWVPEFCEIMFEQSKHYYFKGIALLTRGYIADDRKYLQEIFSIN